MKRIIGILSIVVILIAICLTEELLVADALNKIKKDSDYLYSLSTNSDSVNTEEILKLTEELQDFWKKREMVLCFFIN